MTIPRRVFSIVALLLLVAGRHASAQQSDVIRGRVVGPDSLPIEAATVTVTMISSNTNKSTRTDKNGRFTIAFPGGDGDYFVAFAALGFGAKRFEVKRIADEDVLLADAKLQRVAAMLDPVKVSATRQKPIRNDNSADIGGAERRIDMSGIPTELMGDLAAMASSLPGVSLIPGADGGPDGFSVLGLGADQNTETLNGLPFNGSNLPR